MSEQGPTIYEATYRRSELAMPVLVGLVVALIGGVFVIIKYVVSDHFGTAMAILFGSVVFGMVWIMLTVFRVHRWSVDENGLHIEERPRVPLMGLRRRALLAFTDIAALRRVESGFDRLIEVFATDGRRYCLPQQMTPNARGMPQAIGAADINAFAATIRGTARRAGYELPSATEGLSFWNSCSGLAVLAIMFVMAASFSGLVAWALFDGFSTIQPRGGEMIAFALLLPVGAGWLLLKAFRRRKSVLASLRPH